MTDEQDRHNPAPKPVLVVNQEGKSPFVFVCEHASNYIPEHFDGLGLDPQSLSAHIAWDPGAAEVARHLSEQLNAPLIEATYSRLLIDCNRPLDARDLIPEISETTVIPGNHHLSSVERTARIDLSHRPLHRRIEEVIHARATHGLTSWIVTIHSFTPVYKGISRPWQIGIIHDADARIAEPLIAALEKDKSLNVGVNEPYSPANRVYYTLERHARPRNAPCAMIEIRNDEIATGETQQAWAMRLAAIFSEIERVIP